MKPILAVLLTFFLSTSWANSGLITLESPYSVKQTTDKLQALLVSKGMKIFARIDHAGEAQKSGLELNPTELLIFGNPSVGTLLMQYAPTIAIDLPLKILIWKNAQGKVMLSYTDMQYLKEKHQINGCDQVLIKIDNALKKITEKVIKPE